MDRAAIIRNHPPPYTVTKRDKHGRGTEKTTHDTLSSLEIEVEVASAKIRDPDDPTLSYSVEGIPAELIQGKFAVRGEVLSRETKVTFEKPAGADDKSVPHGVQLKG